MSQKFKKSYNNTKLISFENYPKKKIEEFINLKYSNEEFNNQLKPENKLFIVKG